MFYLVTHTTQFRYSNPVRESVTEVRMHPRSEGFQRCLSFELAVEPRARILGYRDAEGNSIHHFNIPGAHTELLITAESIVEMQTPPRIPDHLDMSAWADLDEAVEAGDYLDYLLPSRFTHSTPLLRELATELSLSRTDGDPLTLLHRTNSEIYQRFSYVPASTRVDSPIDEALRARGGVCQDFTHIMITLMRDLGVPARYCSGYLYHAKSEHDRSTPGATHAWMEAYLPRFGWVGFDPTNDLLTGTRHIRTAIGRDYADVPPTRGIYEGRSKTELRVGVNVSPTNAPRAERMPSPSVGWSSAAGATTAVPYTPYDAGAVQEQSRYEQAPQQQQQG